ncbi:hypothetical protein GCM10007320_54890 [Pseudorhodoferax aquiterrae]|uniref:Uncharacterized protein n=1 Tax=Pseudorhodoferax aquiterrae TaxID=747304 RepID=A0ABQ3G9I6_9BURK|nr:hypothetical protein [Pseudorhodoferax aquiterrae]GHC98826.1 hypothetical protein GCM10007320_54890 [Pseudorhodoferax aquiterrae]
MNAAICADGRKPFHFALDARLALARRAERRLDLIRGAAARADRLPLLDPWLDAESGLHPWLRFKRWPLTPILPEALL